MKRRVVFSVSCAAILTGCVSADVHTWRIVPVPGEIRGGTGCRVGVRSIGLPSAMSQTSVPEPGGAYMANTFQNDLWAGPLATILQIAIVQNLAQRLPSDSVMVNGGAIGAASNQFVEIQILDFSPNVLGQVALSAQLATRFSASQNWQFENFISHSPGGQTPETIVAAMSSLWGEAADRLATMLS